jgi:hypothetical protein
MPYYLIVRTNTILSWQFATSVSQCRTAGPNIGLCIPTYMAGIRQTTTSEFLEDLWKSIDILERIHSRLSPR